MSISNARSIQGQRRPLVVDHYTMGLLLQDLLQTLRYQRAILARYQGTNDD